ncbi:hypothetical protein W97_01662 [Coniosporium apollinis CBS 100218]|uniref:Rhodanese domain-containing protein n=1 Tax=Coniosporium apollinis (strain CBS 100218) TaxID=1168221 RepID=R7YKK9_CONA1|nr:uncharacterized protein W97_01662 [Coniosporium apollinis CBS 100218]EON62440.1 hypothetical protein W97_01662 [Coniosporium apollinis CBS 100218]
MLLHIRPPASALRSSPGALSSRTPCVFRRTLSSYLVTPAELSTALKKNSSSKISTAPRIVPLCATWFLPNDPAKRTGWNEFKSIRIPRAKFFDIDKISDSSSYPHMLPSADLFARAMRRLGIRREDTVVVYDSKDLGIFSAPRVAWTFKVYGHPDVHILNNFKVWCDDGYPTESGMLEKLEAVDYPDPELDKDKVAAFEDVRDVARQQSGALSPRSVQILDARSRGRWEGKEPEPRPGLPSGHIPSSVSVPVSELLHPERKTLLPPAELQALFKQKGVDPSIPTISSCGTGVTAAVIDVALAEAGFAERGRRIYDGSWTEWASRAKQDGMEDALIGRA